MKSVRTVIIDWLLSSSLLKTRKLLLQHVVFVVFFLPTGHSRCLLVCACFFCCHRSVTAMSLLLQIAFVFPLVTSVANASANAFANASSLCLSLLYVAHVFTPSKKVTTWASASASASASLELYINDISSCFALSSRKQCVFANFFLFLFLFFFWQFVVVVVVSVSRVYIYSLLVLVQFVSLRFLPQLFPSHRLPKLTLLLLFFFLKITVQLCNK